MSLNSDLTLLAMQVRDHEEKAARIRMNAVWLLTYLSPRYNEAPEAELTRLMDQLREALDA